MATTTVIYPQGTKFDKEYYKNTHMPLVERKWSPYGLTSWKVIYFPDDAPYTVQATLEWKSLADFQKAASSPEAKEVLSDVPNFSDKQPVLMTGEVGPTSS